MKGKVLKLLPFVLLSILLFSYTFYRAYHFSFTHDEGSSFLNHMERGMIGCMFDPGCWQAANNHLLNSAGMLLSSSLFGSSEWALRLPNLLGHLLYLVSSIIIVFALSSNFWLRFFGFVLFNFQPVLLEFFSLARGYALGASFELAALCCLVMVYKKNQHRWLFCAFMSALLAVYSNFTFIPFYVALLSSIGLLFIFRRKNVSKPMLKFGWYYIVAFSILLLATTYVPITALSQNAEFQFGVGSLFTAFKSLLRENLYRMEWLGGHTSLILTIFFLALVVTSIVVAIRREWVNARKDLIHTLSSVIMVFITLFLVASYFILGAQYPEGRKMIVFIPIMCLLIYQLFVFLAQKREKVVIAFAILLTVLFVDHMRVAVNFKHTRTWYYDGYTKSFLLKLKSEIKTTGTNPSIGIYWIFSPASKYYINTQKIPFSKIERLSKVESDPNFDYYYVDHNDTSKLVEHYHIFEQKGPYFLMRKNTLK